MLPRNFWADLGGGLLELFFSSLWSVFLSPLSGLTNALITWFQTIFTP